MLLPIVRMMFPEIMIGRGERLLPAVGRGRHVGPSVLVTAEVKVDPSQYAKINTYFIPYQ